MGYVYCIVGVDVCRCLKTNVGCLKNVFLCKCFAVYLIWSVCRCFLCFVLFVFAIST